MGGRTAYLDGIRKYYTVKEITDNIKIIKQKDKKASTTSPFYSVRSNRIYLTLSNNNSNKINITEYDGNRELKYRIDFAPHKELKGAHIHTYVNGRQVDVRNLTTKESKFGDKIMKGVIL
ncbi:MAG: hypothetical protein LBH55_03705 [Mycoplasmataceae bacterium]|jgi:hypothetical protein|nr:hypothetical protein [Mycoplasmataceae bacterium]